MSNYNPTRDKHICNFKKQEAMKLRYEKNMTYREIAEQMGISMQYVTVMLSDTVKNPNFKRWKDDATPFPALTRWANNNQVSRAKLASILGFAPCSSNYKRLKDGRITKDEIDRLIDITGIPYDILFRRST